MEDQQFMSEVLKLIETMQQRQTELAQAVVQFQQETAAAFKELGHPMSDSKRKS